MKAAAIEYEKNRKEVFNWASDGIKAYGEHNDYPQAVMDIVAASVTGSACLSWYEKFVYGKGFADLDNYQIVLNDDGETLDTLLRKVTSDYCRFGGFAIHVNRNLLGQITTMRWIPFETVRIGQEEKEQYAGKVAIHPDWGKRKRLTKNIKPEYFWLFTEDREEFLQRVAETKGGITAYGGEVLYYSSLGGTNYPTAMYDSVLTDMASQEALANITYRNCKKGFLPAFVMAEINPTFEPNNAEHKKEFEETGEELAKLQGDKNTSNILHIVVPDKERIPQVLPFRGVNYDKDFTVSEEACRTRIGQCFQQPKEIRCEENSTGFSNDTMQQAYEIYNSTTHYDRQRIEEFFIKVFKFWKDQTNLNFQIQPLTYGTETLLTALGGKVDKVVEIATNSSIDILQRKAILTTIYGVDEDKANNLLQL